MATIQQDEEPKKLLVISVSPPLVNVADGCIKWVVTFPRPGKTFYAKDGFFKMMISLVCKKRKLLNQNEDNAWIQTISSYKLRKKEFGQESKWFKTASGNTIDVIYFVLSVPIGKEDTFEFMLKSQIKIFLISPVNERVIPQESFFWNIAKAFPRVRRVDLASTVLTKALQIKALLKKWCLNLR